MVTVQIIFRRPFFRLVVLNRVPNYGYLTSGESWLAHKMTVEQRFDLFSGRLAGGWCNRYIRRFSPSPFQIRKQADSKLGFGARVVIGNLVARVSRGWVIGIIGAEKFYRCKACFAGEI